MKTNIIRLVITIVLTVFLSSCNNSSNYYTPSYEPQAKINVGNGSRHKYYVEISGPEDRTITLEGNAFQELTLKPGDYTINYTQLEGYVFFPTKRSFSVTLEDGDHKALDID